MIQEAAPDFVAQALLPTTGDGDPAVGTVTLSDYRGHWTLLFFYPLNFTFVCPTEITAFADRHAEFAALNCQLLAASCDSVYSHLAWCNTRRSDGGLGVLKIPLIADFDKSLAKAYGVLLPDGTTLRGSFLISPEGIVRQVTINDLPVGRNVDEALRLLKAFQFADEHGEVCPANWQPGAATISPDPVESKSFFRSQTHDGSLLTTEDDYTRVKFTSLTASPPPSIVERITSWYGRQLKESPILTKSITSATIGILGELLGSYLRNRKSNTKPDFWHSARRVAIFGSYGLFFTGPFFHWWYAFLDRLTHTLGSRLGLHHTDLRIALKLLIQQLVMTPAFLVFTLGYIHYFLSLSVNKTVREIKNAFAAALFANWKVWTVAQAVNFKLVPLDLRVLFGNVVALWWNIYLSMLSTAAN